MDFISQSSFRFTAVISGKYREYLYTPYPPPKQSLPLSTSLTRVGHLLPSLACLASSPPRVLHLHQGSLLVCPFCGFEQIYNKVHLPLEQHAEQFRCPKEVPCALPVHPSLLPTSGSTDLFLVSTNWPFPECHTVGIVQCVAFSDWLLSLSNMHLLRFLHVFICQLIVNAEQYFIAWIYQLIYPFT